MKKELKKLETSVEQYTTEAKKLWKALLPAVEKLEKTFENLSGFYSYVSSNAAFSIRMEMGSSYVYLCVDDRPFPHKEDDIGIKNPDSCNPFIYSIGNLDYHTSDQYCYMGVTDLKYTAKYLSSFILELCQYYTEKAQSLKEVREKYLK